MKKTLAIVLFLFASPALADFNDGVVAYAMRQYDKAFQTFLPLAQTSNHALSQYYLGMMYLNGQGVSQDHKEAGKWFLNAAQQGVPQAQFRLGEMYVSGKGVPLDFEQAYAWFGVASHQSHAKATDAMKGAAEKLSPDELTEAKKLAAELIGKYGKQAEDTQ
jgi:TPR repeat protein